MPKLFLINEAISQGELLRALSFDMVAFERVKSLEGSGCEIMISETGTSVSINCSLVLSSEWLNYASYTGSLIGTTIVNLSHKFYFYPDNFFGGDSIHSFIDLVEGTGSYYLRNYAIAISKGIGQAQIFEVKKIIKYKRLVFGRVVSTPSLSKIRNIEDVIKRRTRARNYHSLKGRGRRQNIKAITLFKRQLEAQRRK